MPGRQDTDRDGTGNNADTDDDNDGVTDAREAELGTQPLNPTQMVTASVTVPRPWAATAWIRIETA